ncbi:Eukaryotic translation initiation factor eIF-1, partial [Coemansia linderi]
MSSNKNDNSADFPHSETKPKEVPAAKVDNSQPSADVKPKEAPASETKPTEATTAKVDVSLPSSETKPKEVPVSETKPTEAPAAKVSDSLPSSESKTPATPVAVKEAPKPSTSKKAYATPSGSEDEAPSKPAATKKKASKASTSKKAYATPPASDDEAPAKPVAPKKTSKPLGKTVGFDADISLDPFNDTNEKSNIQDNIVHIRVQQRNGRKTITTIQGLAKELDLKKILKYMKKTYACNGTVVDDEEHGEIVQLQGDQRSMASTFLIEQKISKKTSVKVH